MLFNTDDLNIDYNTRNTLNLLESMYRIDRIWAKHTPASIPLMESKEYGAFIARYSDLMKLSEEYDASIQECLDAVIYENHLRPNEVIVSLEEWRPYVDPLILHRFSNNYVLVPEINTPAYRLCEICMESFLETGDYNWLDIYVKAPMVNTLQEIADMSKAPTAKQRKTLIQLRTSWENKLRELERQANAGERSEAEIQKDYTSIENQIKSINARLAQVENSPEAKIDKMNKEEKERLKTKASNNNPSTNDEPGWFAQKWTALKNWWNNAGQADSNGNVGFFSNLVGQFKNLIGWGNNNQNNNTTNTNQVNNQAAQPAEKAQDQTNKAAEEAAKKEEAKQKQAEEAAKQQANKTANQEKNDQKQKDNQTAPATAPTKPTDNKTAAPAATT